MTAALPDDAEGAGPGVYDDEPEVEAELGYVDLSNEKAWETIQRRWLVNGFLADGEQCGLGSRRGAGKSLLSIEFSSACAVRGVFSGMPTNQGQGLVTTLHLSMENAWETEKDRLRAMGYGPSDDWSRFRFYALGMWRPFNTKEGSDQLLDRVDNHAASLVVVDSSSKAISGAENANETYFDYDKHTLRELKRRRVASLTLDNFGKTEGRGLRGASSKEDIYDVVWEMTATEDEEYIVLKCTKDRLGLGRLGKERYLHREKAPHLRHVFVTGLPVGISRLISSEAKVDAILDALDAVACPISFGRDRAQDFLKGKVGEDAYRELGGSSTDWSAAIRRRKEGAS